MFTLIILPRIWTSVNIWEFEKLIVIKL